MGAWVSYGLGSLTDDLPTFVVLPDSRGFAPNGPANWSSGFLPAAHQGTMIRPGAKNPIADLFPPEDAGVGKDDDADALALLKRMNRQHEATREGDTRLDARIASYEMAARLQLSAPEVLDLSKEPESVKRMYGLDQTRSRRISAAIAWSPGGCWSAACGSCRSGAGPTTASRAATGTRTRTSPATTATWARAWTGRPPP